MRFAPLLLVFLAAPARADRYVEDWVGTWTGHATWKGCTAAGAEELSVAITWRDGALVIDGAALYDGLGELSPDVHDDGSLGSDEGDIAVAIKRKKKGAVLTLTTAAQCTMTAKLARASTGIDACDGLVALAAAASSCQLTVDDDPSDEVDAWRALSKSKRRAAATQCTTRASALKTKLIAAECVPPEHDPAAAPACREVWRVVSRIDRCEQAPARFKQATHEHAANLRKEIRALTVATAAPYCDEAAQALRDSADELHCNL